MITENKVMKADEAPEKLYYAPYGDIRESHPITDNDIEYIRKDAFIEKACEWWMDNFEYTDDADIKYKNIWDFKNYMKGE